MVGIMKLYEEDLVDQDVVGIMVVDHYSVWMVIVDVRAVLFFVVGCVVERDEDAVVDVDEVWMVVFTQPSHLCEVCSQGDGNTFRL